MMLITGVTDDRKTIFVPTLSSFSDLDRNALSLRAIACSAVSFRKWKEGHSSFDIIMK